MAKFLHKRKVPKNVIIPEKFNIKLKLKKRKHKSIEFKFWQFTLNSPLISEIKQKITEMRNRYRSNNNMRIYDITSEADAHKILNDLFTTSSTTFKILISFGYVFINKTTGQIIANPPSTKYFFKKPQLIRFRSDMTKMLSKINAHSIKFELDQELPDTQSQLIGVYSMGVKIFDLDYPVGTSINLSNYILKSRKINSLNTVENNLCFWLVVH